MQPNLQPCKSCGNADQEQVRFQVYIDQGLQMNIGPFCHCLACDSYFKAKSDAYEDLLEAWNARADAPTAPQPAPSAWRALVSRQGKTFHEYTESDQFHPEPGYYTRVGPLEPLFDGPTVNRLLARLAELEDAEKIAWNNWHALEPVQNFLIEHNLLLTPFDGDGEAAGKNIVHSLQTLLGRCVLQDIRQAVAADETPR